MAAGDDIDHVTVFERDAWTCHICTYKIDKSLRFPHEMAATLDHVIPLCRGGTHTWDNVKASHAICNFEKGDQISEDERRLDKTDPSVL